MAADIAGTHPVFADRWARRPLQIDGERQHDDRRPTATEQASAPAGPTSPSPLDHRYVLQTATTLYHRLKQQQGGSAHPQQLQLQSQRETVDHLDLAPGAYFLNATTSSALQIHRDWNADTKTSPLFDPTLARTRITRPEHPLSMSQLQRRPPLNTASHSFSDALPAQHSAGQEGHFYAATAPSAIVPLLPPPPPLQQPPPQQSQQQQARAPFVVDRVKKRAPWNIQLLPRQRRIRSTVRRREEARARRFAHVTSAYAQPRGSSAPAGDNGGPQQRGRHRGDMDLSSRGGGARQASAQGAHINPPSHRSDSLPLPAVAAAAHSAHGARSPGGHEPPPAAQQRPAATQQRQQQDHSQQQPLRPPPPSLLDDEIAEHVVYRGPPSVAYVRALPYGSADSVLAANTTSGYIFGRGDDAARGGVGASVDTTGAFTADAPSAQPHLIQQQQHQFTRPFSTFARGAAESGASAAAASAEIEPLRAGIQGGAPQAAAAVSGALQSPHAHGEAEPALELRVALNSSGASSLQDVSSRLEALSLTYAAVAQRRLHREEAAAAFSAHPMSGRVDQQVGGAGGGAVQQVVDTSSSSSRVGSYTGSITSTRNRQQQEKARLARDVLTDADSAWLQQRRGSVAREYAPSAVGYHDHQGGAVLTGRASGRQLGQGWHHTGSRALSTEAADEFVQFASAQRRHAAARDAVLQSNGIDPVAFASATAAALVTALLQELGDEMEEALDDVAGAICEAV